MRTSGLSRIEIVLVALVALCPSAASAQSWMSGSDVGGNNSYNERVWRQQAERAEAQRAEARRVAELWDGSRAHVENDAESTLAAVAAVYKAGGWGQWSGVGGVTGWFLGQECREGTAHRNDLGVAEWQFGYYGVECRNNSWWATGQICAAGVSTFLGERDGVPFSYKSEPLDAAPNSIEPCVERVRLLSTAPGSTPK